MKFILTVADTFAMDRGAVLIEVVEHFAKMFTNIKALKNSLSLVVTQVDPGKQAQHIQTVITKMLVQNQALNDPAKASAIQVLEYLKDSVHVFHKPVSEEGIILAELNLSHFSKLKPFITSAKAVDLASASKAQVRAGAGYVDAAAIPNSPATGNHSAILTKYKDTAEALLQRVYSNIDKLQATAVSFFEAEAKLVSALAPAAPTKQSFFGSIASSVKSAFAPNSEAPPTPLGLHKTLMSEGSESTFSLNYGSFVKKLLPPSAARHHDSQLHLTAKPKYFAKLHQLSAIKSKLEAAEGAAQAQNLDIALKAMTESLHILAGFNEEILGGGARAKFASTHANDSPLKQMIGDYIHVLSQQVIYMRFFEGLCKAQAKNPLSAGITQCKKLVEAILKDNIATINLKNHSDAGDNNIEYYNQAIEWLRKSPDVNDPKISNIVADGMYTISSISEKMPHNKKVVLQYSITALTWNKKLFDVYEKIGDLFCSKHREDVAIKYYKVVNHSIKISGCFKTLIDKDPTNPKIREEAGDYFLSICCSDEASKSYNAALGLSKDQAKQGEICL